MRRLNLMWILTVLTLGIASAYAADAITSDAPPLPDFAGSALQPGDMTLPGLDVPLPAPPSSPTASTPTTSSISTAAVTAVVATPTVVAQIVATTVPVAPPPAPLAESPTPVIVSTVASPTAVAEVATPTTAASVAAVVSADPGAVVLEGLEAYFPMKTGSKWTYASKSGQTRSMECLSRDAQGKTVSGTFLVTTTAPVTQTWKLVGGKVVLGATASSLRAGWVRLVTPVGATIPRWVYDRLDGTASYYKQEVGPVEAGGKKYTDALTVTERTLKGAAQVSLRKWFYAKGVGLVMEADYGATGAVVANKSFELQSAQ